MLFFLVAATIVGISFHGSLTSALMAFPPVLIALVSFISATGRVSKRAETALVTALQMEIGKDKIDHDLAGTQDYAGRARDLVALLEGKAITLTSDERARILECDDAPTLEQWLRNALMATSASDVFDGPKLRVDPALADATAPAEEGAEDALDEADANDDDEKRDNRKAR